MIAPLNLTFAQEPIRDAQWPHSATETALISSTENFAELMTAVATFFKPVVTAIHVGIPLSARWDPPPWSYHPVS